MGLELIFGKPHLSGEGKIAQHSTYRHERGFWSRFIGFFSFIAKAWRKAFVARELFIRNANGTHRIVLEKGVQIQLAIVGLGLIFWLAYATSGVLLGKSSNKIMQERLAETHNAYEAKISSLQKEYEELNLRIFLAEKAFSKISDELTQRHNHLTNLLGMQERIGKKMKQRNQLQKKIKKRSKSAKQSILKPLRNHDSVLLTSRPAGPSYEYFPARPLKLNKDREFNKIVTGNKRIDAISRRVAELDRQQRAILDHIEENISLRLKNYHRAFFQTEAVKADLFTQRVEQMEKYSASNNRAPIGGPFISVPEPEKKKSAAAAAAQKIKKQEPQPFVVPYTRNNAYKVSMQARTQVSNLEASINNLAKLDKSIAFLPIAKPMPLYYVTSAFGPRIDPFTREWAFHTGVDISGKHDKVQATLPGIVRFAGAARGYGKMVEIDHGFGIKTRYGHLKKISVRKGNKVRFKQAVGLMGNTGRSTGEHLHYEILFNGKPYDPWKFMEAGKNVFEALE